MDHKKHKAPHKKQKDFKKEKKTRSNYTLSLRNNFTDKDTDKLKVK